MRSPRECRHRRSGRRTSLRVRASSTALPTVEPVAASDLSTRTVVSPRGAAVGAPQVLAKPATQAAGVPAGTPDAALSTPWTVFDRGVDVVAGNLSFSELELAVPSIGSATTISRTYNSAAAPRRRATAPSATAGSTSRLLTLGPNGVTVALGAGTLSVTYAAPTFGPTAHVIFEGTGYFVP